VKCAAVIEGTVEGYSVCILNLPGRVAAGDTRTETEGLRPRD